jgi:hypothetical protein
MHVDVIRKIAVDGKVDVELLAKIQNIECRLRQITHQENIEWRRHMDATAALDTERRSIQATCGHKATTYCADASGGSDSSTTCDICGADLRKR